MASIWERPPSHGQQKRLTVQTSSYDHFLSHDWGTAGWLKFMTLLVHFNGRAAAVACFLVSISVGTVTSFGLPVHPAVTIFGYITYALFLVYWQSLRRLWRQKLVFLDKVCVPQDQEELKKASIHGLSAFLDRSEELLVLWSSKYLTRLWCTFEVATFLREGHKTKQVTVLPVHTAVFFAINYLVWFILQTSSMLILHSSWDVAKSQMTLGEFLSQTGAHLVVSFSLKPAFLLLFVVLMKDVALLPQQLESFQVQKAKCHCCSVKLRDVDGSKIPCDRQLIYGILEGMYGSPDSEHLELFNKSVRITLAQQVVRRLKDNTLFAYHLGVSGLACSFPWLAVLIPYWVAGPESECQSCYITWLLRDIMNWLSLPVTLLLQVHLALHLAKLGVPIENWVRLFVLTKQQTLIAILIWLPGPLSMVLTDCCNPLPLLLGLGPLLLNIYLYWPSGTSQEPSNAEKSEMDLSSTSTLEI